MEAAVPWLYLKGVSSGEMGEALKVLVGPKAQGLSASTVSRLKRVWAEEYRIGCDQRLGRRPLGLCLGRRYLQRTSSRTNQVVCVGRNRRE